MNDIFFVVVSFGVAVLLVLLGFIMGGLLPAVIKNSTKSDIEVVAYLREKADATSEVEKTRVEDSSSRLEKKLYNLELSMACILGERLEAEELREKEA